MKSGEVFRIETLSLAAAECKKPGCGGPLVPFDDLERKLLEGERVELLAVQLHCAACGEEAIDPPPEDVAVSLLGWAHYTGEAGGGLGDRFVESRTLGAILDKLAEDGRGADAIRLAYCISEIFWPGENTPEGMASKMSSDHRRRGHEERGTAIERAVGGGR